MKKENLYAYGARLFLVATILFSVAPAHAETLEDLSRRVRILEQAVQELQEQCAVQGEHRQASRKEEKRDIWTCQVSGRKRTYYGNGISRGLAERDAMEQCQQMSRICHVKECSKKYLRMVENGCLASVFSKGLGTRTVCLHVAGERSYEKNPSPSSLIPSRAPQH